MQGFCVVEDEFFVGVGICWEPEASVKLFAIGFNDGEFVDLSLRNTLAPGLNDLQLLVVYPHPPRE